MSITSPLGFRAAGTTAGIKPSGKPDLALIVRDGSPEEGRAGSAMVFTRNAVIGAPIIIGKQRREAILGGGQGPLRAILINAGNSNAATGQQGVDDALRCCQEAAGLIGCQARDVVPSSTGVIGRPLPTGKIVAALPGLVAALARGEQADRDAAAAIMTTDTVPKSAALTVNVGGRALKFGAIGKGSGMIAPRLDSAFGASAPAATMLAFITTDAAIGSGDLQLALEAASLGSFDRINVDDHPSCSDTVIALASGAGGGAGASGGEPIRAGGPGWDAFTAGLREICESLARQIIVDGEGASRVFRITVRGTRTNADAQAMASRVVASPLVKCAIHGRDPNWGRIVTAAGNAGIYFDTAHAALRIGGVEVYQGGVPVTAALSDPKLREAMAAKEVELELTVGSGAGTHWMLGCDLSKDYVVINAEYTT